VPLSSCASSALSCFCVICRAVSAPGDPSHERAGLSPRTPIYARAHLPAVLLVVGVTGLLHKTARKTLGRAEETSLGSTNRELRVAIQSNCSHPHVRGSVNGVLTRRDATCLALLANFLSGLSAIACSQPIFQLFSHTRADACSAGV
jgi:hypothetical protein